MTPSKQNRICAILLAACAVVALACVAYPLYVIRPFRAQGPHELAFALAVLRWRSFLTGLCAGLAIAMCAYFLGQAGWRRRVVSIAAALFVCACAVLVHVNVYELMFHPMGRPTFQPAAESKLDGGEEVLAVKVHGQARAYPVRVLAYHHIANDVVAGEPIVATY